MNILTSNTSNKHLKKNLNKKVTNCVVISGKIGYNFFFKERKVYMNLICRNLVIPIICSRNSNIENYKGQTVIIKGRIGKTYENIKDTTKYKSKLAIFVEYMEVVNDL